MPSDDVALSRLDLALMYAVLDGLLQSAVHIGRSLELIVADIPRNG